MAVTTFADDVVQNLPRLEGFARRLAGNRSFADDLVQETVLRALVHADHRHLRRYADRHRRLSRDGARARRDRYPAQAFRTARVATFGRALPGRGSRLPGDA